MDNHYGGVIWTNHALQRLSERGISQSDAYYTFQRPQESRYAKKKGAWIFYRNYGQERLEVVASQNEKKEWVIMSVWKRPILGRKEYIKIGFLEDVVEKILRKLFGKVRK